jgi:phage anti-repressor protein
MTTGHIKDTLLYSYKEKIDYKIIKGKSNGMKGKPKDTILLTPKCFKIMAMQSRTKKAIQVREYYYELEQVIDQYKEYIIKGLEDKIKKLEIQISVHFLAIVIIQYVDLIIDKFYSLLNTILPYP